MHNDRTCDVKESQATIKGHINMDGEIELELSTDYEHKIIFGTKEDAHEYLGKIKLIIDRIYWETKEINYQIAEGQDLTPEDNPYKDIRGWEEYSKKLALN